MFIKSRLEYKISFFVGMFSNFYCYLITFLSVWILVSRFGNIGGWEFDEISFLYGMNLMTYAIAGMFFWPIFRIESDVTGGNLDYYMIRPLGIVRQLVCSHFGDTFIGQIIVAAIFIINSISKRNINIICLIIMIVSGTALQAAAMIILGSLSFWTKRSSQLSDILYYDFRKFVDYPLSIFPKWINFLMTFIIPWALISYYPALIVLNKANNVFEYTMGYLTPIISILCFAMAIRIFYIGLEKYEGSGS
jgi:ABC-2 type transport system permease protein